MRFQTKLLLLFLLQITAVVGALSWLNYQAQTGFSNQVEAELERLLNTVHFSIDRLSSAQGPDRQVLDDFIRDMRKQGHVREVTVVGSQRKILASSDRSKVGRDFPLERNAVLVREQIGVDSSGKPGKQYEVRVPLIRDGKVMGLVQTRIALRDFNSDLTRLHQRTLAAAIAVISLAFAVAMFAVYRMLKPLRLLGLAADGAAAGNLAVSVDYTGSDEFGRATRAFNEMMRKLADRKELEDRLHSLERNAIISEMAASMAHEIRNQLNLINLTVDHFISRRSPEGLQSDGGDAPLIESLKAEVRHLNRIVSDFLLLGRPDVLKLQDVTAISLAGEVEMLVRQSLTAKGVKFHLECPPRLGMRVDPEKIRVVLLNLVINALEVVSTGGEIKFGAGSEGTEAWFTVQDNGPGIDTDHLAKVFDPYFTRKRGGTGLGLAVAKRLVTEHGGTITAANASPHGALFRIMLPIQGQVHG